MDRRAFVRSSAIVIASAWKMPNASGIPQSGGAEDVVGTVVLVRGTDQGGIVLRHVRGEAAISAGSHIITDIPLPFPKQSAADPNQISRPTAIRHPVSGHTVVARATFNPGAGTTSIHTASAMHPTMLAESLPTTFVRQTIISSAVVLSHFGGQLLLAWNEAGTIKSCSSTDGVTWSAINNLATLPAAELFALWSEGDKLLLATTTSGRSAIVVKQSANGNNWVQQFPSAGMYACISSNPFCLTAPIGSLSIATTTDHVFVAYGEAQTLKIAKFRKGPIAISLRSLVVSVVRQLTNPNPSLHHVVIHRSRYGWTLAFTESFDDASSPTGRTFYVGGLWSNDGLDYTGTEFGYARGSVLSGYPSLVETGLPMPWMVRLHDSGRPPNSPVYNFVITADGFTYAEREHLYQIYQTMTASLVDTAPFAFNQDLFNVWGLLTFSKDSGWNDPSANPPREAMFGSTLTANVPNGPYDPMKHATLLLTGKPYPGHYYGWTFYNGVCGVGPWDNHGVSMCELRLHSLPSIHEYMHTVTGGFDFGDHELRANQNKIVNKTFDGTFSPSGHHAWQDWFEFSGTAPSRLIPVTDSFKAAVMAWVAAGNTPRSYYGFPYSTDPTSSSYVDALSLFQVGLWESDIPDVGDLNASPLYTALRACMMQSQIHHGTQFCPICSRVIVEHLSTVAGVPFSITGFKVAPGAYLEFQSQNQKVCGETATPAPLALDNLVVINGHPLSISDFAVHQSDDLQVRFVARANLTPWITPSAIATVVFKQRNTGETRLWIPGIQVLNSKGARLHLHPAQVTLPSGKALVDRLHEMHPTSQVQSAVGCDYEFWQLSEGDLTLTFRAH